MLTQRIAERLARQHRQGLYRDPAVIFTRGGRTVQVGRRQLLNFASNDYLGLGASKPLARELARNFEKWGSSGSSSRLVSGNYGVIGEAEAALAEYFGYDRALIYPSGYQCNLGVIGTVFEKGDRVFADKHVHASSIAAVKLSRARFHGFKHNCMDHLERRMAGLAPHPAGLLTESLFSMDGDLLDVKGLVPIQRRHALMTIVDEAHAFGALGYKGQGIARCVADIAVGTFGKALGLFGAFALMPQTLREYLMNFSSPLIYTTTLPEAHGASVLSVLKCVAAADDERQQLARVSVAMKTRLQEAGFTVRGDAHIIAVEIGSEKFAGALCKRLFDRGLFVFSARFPTVPLHRAILRLSMTARHTLSDVNALVTALKEAHHELGL